jgi:hypothetical protein
MTLDKPSFRKRPAAVATARQLPGRSHPLPRYSGYLSAFGNARLWLAAAVSVEFLPAADRHPALNDRVMGRDPIKKAKPVRF